MIRDILGWIWDTLEIWWLNLKSVISFFKWVFSSEPKELCNDMAELFCPESYEDSHGRDDRFPSVVSPVARFLCRNFYLAVPVCVIVVAVAQIILGIPLGGIIVYTILLVPLLLLGIVILMLSLTAMEAFAKLCTCLILYGELPVGAENFIDAFLLSLARDGSL